MRGDSAKCFAESERTGRVCEVCGFGDHSDYHHRLAAADAHYVIQQEGQLKWHGGGKINYSRKPGSDGSPGGSTGGTGAGRGGGKGGNPRAPPDPSVPCPYGTKCFKLNRTKYPAGCGWKHPPTDYYDEPSGGNGGSKGGGRGG